MKRSVPLIHVCTQTLHGSTGGYTLHQLLTSYLDKRGAGLWDKITAHTATSVHVPETTAHASPSTAWLTYSTSFPTIL